MGLEIALQKLFALPMGGDYDNLMTVLGNLLDDADSRVDDLLDEIFPAVGNELFSSWLKAYGLAFDAGDSDAWKLKVLLAKLNELGGQSIAYFAKLASYFDEIVTIRDSLLMKFGEPFGGTFYGAEHVHSAVGTIKARHRLPFTFGDTFGGKFVDYDKRNSIEALFLRLKPAHTHIFFNLFNWDFETGNLKEWIVNSDKISWTDPHSGTYHARLKTVTGALNGIKSYPFIIAANRKYQIDAWHKIFGYSAGTYYFEINYYSDVLGENLISTDEMYSRSANTGVYEQSSKTVAPAGITSDFDFPDNAKSFRISRRWGTGGYGSAYIDDIDIAFA